MAVTLAAKPSAAIELRSWTPDVAEGDGISGYTLTPTTVVIESDALNDDAIEMFISGGENVYPAEVENVLSAHPAVAEAAVVGAPDPQWGEIGQAFFRLQPGAATPSASELQSFCRSRLAPYKVPRIFEAVADFPRTPAGKIRKHLLGADGTELQCGAARHKAEAVRG